MDEIEGVYAIKQFQELCRLHKMSILIHSRSQYSRDLARKLRPEFNKLLLTTDVRVCIKLIAKRNAEINGGGGIDLVVIDYDPSTLKLLEYINKRPMMEETIKHPLIPTIVLLNESAELGTRENIEAVGGSNAIFQLPVRTSLIMSEIIDILHRRRQLDSTFKDLKQNRVQYPFLGVFTVSKDEIEREAKEASTVQGGVILLEEKDAIFDEWMECESILQPDLQAIRSAERERKDPVEFRDQRFSNAADRLMHEMSERMAIDRKLSRTAHLALAELHGSKKVITQEMETNFEAMMAVGNEDTV